MVEDGPRTFLGPVGFFDRITVSKINLRLSEETIVSGVISFKSSYMAVTAQGGAADDLDTINGGTDGDIVMLVRGGTDNVTVKDGTGNISIGADFIINNADDVVTLLYRGSEAQWISVSTKSN